MSQQCFRPQQGPIILSNVKLCNCMNIAKPILLLSNNYLYYNYNILYSRPLYLPFRTVLTLGNFSVTSNLIAATNTSCLRFIAQECTLFLMHIIGTKPNTAVPLDDDKLPDIVKDYVCVVDLGVFELSLRMADKNNCVSILVFNCCVLLNSDVIDISYQCNGCIGKVYWYYLSLKQSDQYP